MEKELSLEQMIMLKLDLHMQKTEIKPLYHIEKSIQNQQKI